MPVDPRAVWKHLALTARTALALRALPAWRLPQVMADIALLRLRHDIQLDEYTDYLFWENRAEKLKHHFTFRDHDQFNRQMNELKLTYVLADKRVLLRRMGPELGRQYWELDKVSAETFHSILLDRDRLIAKPPRLGDGRGIRVIPGRLDRAASDRLYDELIAQGCILLEEYITQHPALDRLYPEAVSVVKIHTFGCQEDCRIVLYPMLIVGSQGGTISNHHPIAIGIRRETAGLEALSVSGLSAHPDTGCPFASVSLPFYEQAEALALQLARRVPEMYYACWDIALSTQGPVVMEGNSWPLSSYIMQVVAFRRTGLGNKLVYQGLLEEAERFRQSRPAEDLS